MPASSNFFSTFIYSILSLLGITLLYIILTGVFEGGALLAFKIPLTREMNLDDIPPGKNLIIKSIGLMAPVTLFFLFKEKFGFSFAHIYLPPDNARLFVRAFLFSLLLIAAASGVIFVLNGIQLTMSKSFSLVNMLFSFLFFSVAALNEELLSRVIYLEYMMRKHGKWLTLVTCSAFFMCLHLGNPNISVLSLLNIFLAGILLGQLYLYNRRNLFFVTIFHMGWNFFQGPVFGFAVSGMYLQNSIIKQIPEAGSKWSQKNFGLEGTLECAVVLTISIIAIELWHKKKSGTLHEEYFRIRPDEGEMAE